MPRRPRRDTPASIFHVINRSVRKVPIFVNRADYRAFLTVLTEGLRLHPVKLISYCVMPNHWHLVVGPNGTDQLSTFMKWVTGTHAIRWHHHHKTVGQGPVYQGRFHATAIGAAADLVHVCRYVERNALRAALVQRAQDWPWCSLSDRLRADTALPLEPAIFLSSNMWVEYVNAAVTTREQIERQRALPPTSVPDLPKSVENRPVPLSGDQTDDPGGLAQVSQLGEDFFSDMTGDDDHQPDAHVERPEHLGIVNVAAALKPREDRRYHPALAVE